MKNVDEFWRAINLVQRLWENGVRDALHLLPVRAQKRIYFRDYWVCERRVDDGILDPDNDIMRLMMP